MFKKIRTLFSATKYKRFNPLGDILLAAEQKENFLGVRRVQQRPEDTTADAAKVVQFSKTEEYAIWASEAWRQVISCVDKLTRNNLSQNESDFYRGVLSATLDHLRISYNAVQSVKESKNTKRESNLKVEF